MTHTTLSPHWWPCFVVLLIAVLAGCSTKETAESQPLETVITHATFSIRMPAEARTMNQKLDFPEGAAYLTMYEVDQKVRSYVFAVADYPAATIARVGVEAGLEGARDGMLQPNGNRMTSSQRIDVAGNPAIEFAYQGQLFEKRTGKPRPIIGYVRIILVENTAITAAVNGLVGEVSREAAERYWDTLTIGTQPKTE